VDLIDADGDFLHRHSDRAKVARRPSGQQIGQQSIEAQSAVTAERHRLR
jgi:hypothetical protein